MLFYVIIVLLAIIGVLSGYLIEIKRHTTEDEKKEYSITSELGEIRVKKQSDDSMYINMTLDNNSYKFIVENNQIIGCILDSGKNIDYSKEVEVVNNDI